MPLRLKPSVVKLFSASVGLEDFDETKIETMDAGSIRTLSWIAQFTGSPLGLLPILMTAYYQGEGKNREYEVNNVYKNARLPVQVFLTLLRRGLIDSFGDLDIKRDMADQGYSEERLNALISATEYLPTPQDLIQFAVKEVYSPETAQRFGQFQDFPDDVLPDAEAIGLTREVLEKYWAAHWNLPSPTQGYEMLHRGIISEDDLQALLKALDIMPFWRDKLTEMSYNIPTRVDVRRFYDLGVVDEEYLRKVYSSLGYHGADLDAYVLFTKIYTVLPDIVSRYKNGWITSDDAIRSIIQAGLSADKARELWETKVKNLEQERTAKERDLTISQIFKAVKKGRLERETGLAMITKLGYDDFEATLLLDVNVPLDDTDTAQETRLLNKADIKAALVSGVMPQDEAIKRLLALNYTPDDAALLIRLFMYSVEKPSSPQGKQLSKADITKGVKDGVITPEEGYILLTDIGYNDQDANYILSINPVKESHSVTRIDQFTALINAYRKGAGLPLVELPGDALRLEDNLREAQAALSLMIKGHAPESDILLAQGRVKGLKAQLRQALAT